MQTIIVSDMHLAEAARAYPSRPHWMAYKRREHFIDDDFARMLDHLVDQVLESGETIELVLNGDIFDFDSIIELPEEPQGHVDWLARLRGLGSEEWMSCFKMQCIVRDHPVWFGALKRFIERGHRAVFVIGNHDLELYWPSVQAMVGEALGVDPDDDALRFNSWFYISAGDTYVSHGHVYDPNCAMSDPIDPLIEVHGRPRVRIPFGDLAGRIMLNGMGYFNPHATGNYIMTGTQYARFFVRYMLRTQPFLLWTWFWSAVATLVISMRDHLKHPMRDPLLVDEKVRAIAKRANATPSMVRQLAALCVPPSCSRPLAVIRELWLDRGFLFIGLLFLAWQVVLHVNIALPISPLWVFAALGVLIPPYLVYASRVKPTVFDEPLLDEQRAQLISRITGARNVVFGHTHVPHVSDIAGVRFINGGFWSPAFAEPECKNRLGTQTFVWLRPAPSGERVARLFEWAPGALAPVAYVEPAQLVEPQIDARPSVAPSDG